MPVTSTPHVSPERPQVLAASDLSEGSNAALVWAAAWATATGAGLHLVHCVPRPVFPYWSGAFEDEVVDEWVRHAATRLGEQYQGCCPGSPEAESVHVAFGEPAAEVSAHAAKLGASALVLGPHRPRVVFDDILGTTADRILRTAPIPCVAANRPFPELLRQVLFPVDFSRPSHHAVDVGMALLAPLLKAATADAPLVIEFLFVSAYASPSKKNFQVEPALQQVIERATAHVPAGAAVRLLPRILSAPLPVEGIHKAADRMEADLIIMGTHGYSSLGRALIGSVASAVTRTVPFAVVLVPPPDPHTP